MVRSAKTFEVFSQKVKETICGTKDGTLLSVMLTTKITKTRTGMPKTSFVFIAIIMIIVIISFIMGQGAFDFFTSGF